MSTTVETPSGSKPRGIGNQGGKMTLDKPTVLRKNCHVLAA